MNSTARNITAAAVAASLIGGGMATATAASAAPAKPVYTVGILTCKAHGLGNGHALVQTTNRAGARKAWRRVTDYASSQRAGHDAISRVILFRGGNVAADAKFACHQV